MKLIIGLGNPWDKYKLTRHNLWFLFVDYFAAQNNFVEFHYESKFKWEISSWNYKWEKTLLLKPETYMNLSWESVLAVTQYYKINTTDIIIVFDDMSMDFWKVRFREMGSAWWHNWMKDIIKKFGENVKRLKVWIGQDTRYDVSDWVLSKFTEEERIELEPTVFEQVEEKLRENF